MSKNSGVGEEVGDHDRGPLGGEEPRLGLALAAVPILALALPPQQVVPVIVGLQLMAGVIDLPLAWRAAKLLIAE